MDKVQFELNVPQTIALKYAKGKPVQSQYTGEQTMYTLTDGRVMYASPALSGKIDALEVAAGEPFVVCYRELKGAKREWQVWRDEPKRPSVSPAASVVQAVQSTPDSSSSPQPIITASEDAIPPRSALTAMMAGALVAAIEALATAREFGKKHGFPDLHFREDDIRAMASTIFIAYAKDAENRARQYPQQAQRVNGGASWPQ